MSSALQSRTIAFLVHDRGAEQPEPTTPSQAVKDAGGTPVPIAPEAGTVPAVEEDVKRADTFPVDVPVDAAAGYDALVLPGTTPTSFPGLQTDIRHAGAEAWVDEGRSVRPANGWTLVTSRNPDDLAAFSATLVAEFGKTS